MRDHSPTYLLHMAAPMMLILAHYDVIPILMRSMVGRETHLLDVSLEGDESLSSFYSACSEGSMMDMLATISGQLHFYEVSHVIGRIPRDDEYELLSITDEMMWAILICNVGGEIFGDLNIILPLEGNTLAG